MISDIFFSQKNIDRIYKVNDVTVGFRYWFWKLFNLLQEMFVYQGLPDTLPAREIEINLLLTGHCIIFDHDFDLQGVRRPRFDSKYGACRLGYRILCK